MEYVKGRTLHRWAQEENPSAREVAGLVLKRARAQLPHWTSHVAYGTPNPAA